MLAPAILSDSDLLQGVRFFFEQVADRPWVSLIEILLIGGVVYAILRSLEGTRGARLIRAVLTILVVSFAVVWLIAERFELDRVNAIYPYFILAVFLVSLIAFQSDLRRALLQLGEGRLFQRLLGGSAETIDAVVTAVDRLAHKRIGALIAIERSDESAAIAESGVPLDAAVTSELLETIFWPGSALHDLGVLISQTRVRAAGCQFPLTESVDLERTLGSRHRAAIGMSEETDAVVIIVSEETGTISVAMQGRLRRGLTPESLRELLVRELGADAELFLPKETEEEAGAPPALDEEPTPAPAKANAGEPPELTAAPAGESKADGADQAA
ncbi:MAG: diadenylate cyclase CdaA [Phycisphaerales bacterium]|nr:diadenylate cyclase CdaA [Phycisphaerales bacterium]